MMVSQSPFETIYTGDQPCVCHGEGRQYKIPFGYCKPLTVCKTILNISLESCLGSHYIRSLQLWCSISRLYQTFDNLSQSQMSVLARFPDQLMPWQLGISTAPGPLRQGPRRVGYLGGAVVCGGDKRLTSGEALLVM